MPAPPDRSSSNEAELFDRRVERAGAVPLWTFFKEWFPGEPRTTAVGHLWRYDTLRPLLLEAAERISADATERRVLALENPALPGRRVATGSLYAGLQLILPGEIAPAHRHTAAALRFVIEGHGAYTAVSGERAYMHPGDLIVTPSWTWHEHGNEGEGPTIWLDVLDVAFVRFLGAGFSEHHPQKRFPERTPSGASKGPQLSYPYARARQAAARGALDPCHGVKREYLDPAHGGVPISTISTFLQWLPPGFVTEPYASTAGALYVAVEGGGRVTIGAGDAARRFEFGARDIWAVPSWQPMLIQAGEEETVLFSASDEAVQRRFGMWRERRGDE